MKTLTISSTMKASSDLPPNLTAHERERKYPTGTFHVNNGLKFCLHCNIVIDHLRKTMDDKHLNSALHKHLANFNQWDVWNMVEKVLFVTKIPVVNLYSRSYWSLIWHVTVAVSFQLLTRGVAIVQETSFFSFIPTNVNQDAYMYCNYCSLVFKVSYRQQSWNLIKQA